MKKQGQPHVFERDIGQDKEHFHFDPDLAVTEGKLEEILRRPAAGGGKVVNYVKQTHREPVYSFVSRDCLSAFVSESSAYGLASWFDEGQRRNHPRGVTKGRRKRYPQGCDAYVRR
jgi:hypothetical protein